MPEVLGNPPSPRTALFWNGTAWQWALVDAAGHLQIDVIASGLPAGAATAANQAIMITALQLIDNLVVALGGPGNARLIVRGEDQLYSYAGNLASRRTAVISGANGWVASNAPPAGQIWRITTIEAVDSTSPTTAQRRTIRTGGVIYTLDYDAAARAAAEHFGLHGNWWLDPTDTVRLYFEGGLVGDSCDVALHGHIMTLEA